MPQTADISQTTENQTEVMEVEFAETAGIGSSGVENNIDMLLDITMPVTVSLGGTHISIKQLLGFGPGSVLQLDKMIDEPAELYVQDVKFATGDIVVVDGHFALRIKEIIGAESQIEGK